MRYCIYAILVACVTYAGSVHGQSAIKCDLVQLAHVAFSKNPNIARSSYAIQNVESDLQIQRSVFDLNSFSELSIRNTQYNLLGADPRATYIDGRSLRSNVLNLSGGVRRRVRTGQIAELGVNYGFSNNNYPINSFNQPINSYLGNNASTLNFSLTQPLLRGRGRPVATALEKAYVLYVENAKSNNEFNNSYELWQIGIAYWNYYTAFKSLDAYKQSEERIRSVLSVTEDLVKGDKKPAGDLVQIRADLASQEKLTIIAEQDVYAARIQLGKAAGLSHEESLLLGTPETDYPTVSQSLYEKGLDQAAFIRIAKEERADLRAVRQGNEALKNQYQLAGNNVKPQLDLTGLFSYGSVSTGNGFTDVLSSFSNNLGRTLGTGVKLTYTFPVNNNLARGNLVKSYVALNDQGVVLSNIQRTIDLDVSNDLNYLNNSVSNLQKAEEVLTFNQEVFKNEQLRFQSGLTTLLSLILFQERFTTAQLRYLQAYRQFAVSIINLRHDTGTLIQAEGKGFAIDQSAFYTIPK